jgi:2-(1,2-epoxy-1,2-dihydrophenyl)acetyl-CoA isomerase
MYNSLLFEEKDGVGYITLNRLDRFNAFNEELSAELIDALKKTAKSDTIRVVVLSGAGKAFCSGQDLKDVQGSSDKRSLGDSVLRRYNPMIVNVRENPKPIICRLNGVAAGAGASLAMACDIIVSAAGVQFVEAFANIGLVLDSGASFFLPNTIPYNRAFELVTLGEKFSAEEAFSWGLVNKVVAAEELDSAVKEYTDRYVNSAPIAMRLLKKMLNKGMTSTLTEALQYEAYCQEIAGSTEDYKEGVASFVEKRKPVFKGK